MKNNLFITAAIGATLLLFPGELSRKYLDKIKEHLRAQACLTANIFFEARGESEKGMQAVAKVTMNRFKSKKFPESICGVVFQRKQFSWTHQLPWNTIQKALNGATNDFSIKDRQAYELSQKIAQNALKNIKVPPLTSEVLWYHATYVKPKWSYKMQKVGQIGNHVFYK